MIYIDVIIIIIVVYKSMHETWNSGENVEHMMDTGYVCLFYVFISKNESLLVLKPADVLVCLHFPVG